MGRPVHEKGGIRQAAGCQAQVCNINVCSIFLQARAKRTLSSQMAQEHRQSIRRDPGICKEQVPDIHKAAGMPLHHRDPASKAAAFCGMYYP